MRIFLLLLISYLSLIAFPEESCADSRKEPLKIGVILHLTGELASQGQGFLRGIKLAQDEINKAGGVGGNPVELVVEDSRLSGSDVNRAAKKLIEIDGVKAALISTFQETKTAGPLFERAKIPLLCLRDSTPELDEMGAYLFSIGTWLPATGKRSAEFAFDSLKARRAATIAMNGEWNLRVAKDFADAFRKHGGTVVFQESINHEQADFKTLLLKVKQQKADVLYAPIDSSIGAFFKQVSQVLPGIAVIQSDIFNKEIITEFQPVLQGVYQSQTVDPSGDAAIELAKRYVKKYGSSPEQLLFTAWGYDGLKLLAHAAENEGLNSESIKTGLYEVDGYAGASGEITVSPEGSSRQGVSMFQVKGNDLKLVEK